MAVAIDEPGCDVQTLSIDDQPFVIGFIWQSFAHRFDLIPHDKQVRAFQTALWSACPNRRRSNENGFRFRYRSASFHWRVGGPDLLNLARLLLFFVRFTRLFLRSSGSFRWLTRFFLGE